jgi:hypothetical protein
MERQVCPFQNVSIEGFTPLVCAKNVPKMYVVGGKRALLGAKAESLN